MTNRLIGRIEAACRSVCEFPQAGPARDTLAPGLRVTFEGRYAIYYRFTESELAIVRVLHGARDLTALANRDPSF